MQDEEFVATYIQKPYITETASGSKIVVNIPKPLAQYVKEKGAIVVILTKKDFISYLANTCKLSSTDQELSETVLTQALSKLLSEKLRKLVLEVLKLE